MLYSLLVRQRVTPGYCLFLSHPPLITLFSEHHRSNDRELSIIAGPPTYTNLLFYVQRLIILFLPQNPTQLSAGFDVSSALNTVRSNVFDASLLLPPAAILSEDLLADCDISLMLDFFHSTIIDMILSSTPDDFQSDVLLDDCHIDFLHRRSV